MEGIVEVDEFLKDFKQKMQIWDVLFRDDRGKNSYTLAKLEIRPIDRKKVLEELVSVDYCEGPLKDNLNGKTDLWVFGKVIKGNEIYIKITMGLYNTSVICISFHLAEHKLNYPNKKQ